LRFENVREHSLEWIWAESPGFQAYRGDEWMAAPCRDCPRKAIDYGGCRCQAFALTGAATNTDPVCTLSPLRSVVDDAVADATGPIDYRYRYLSLERAPTTSSGHGHGPSGH
jgi:pyrroloquinoline quinone biosynthesis protein E